MLSGDTRSPPAASSGRRCPRRTRSARRRRRRARRRTCVDQAASTREQLVAPARPQRRGRRPAGDAQDPVARRPRRPPAWCRPMSTASTTGPATSAASDAPSAGEASAPSTGQRPMDGAADLTWEPNRPGRGRPRRHPTVGPSDRRSTHDPGAHPWRRRRPWSTTRRSRRPSTPSRPTSSGSSRASPRSSTSPCSAWSPRVTCSSRTCPASARPAWPRRWPARSTARFGRIQFTPDLLPSDVVGVTVWNRSDGRFEFRPGPVFANIVLGDEINRASPKTQSALLEAMDEGQVTVDGATYPLGPPFMVIATQNPIEHEGTYPLPESQLDRFLMRVSVGYPSRDAEIEMLDTHGDHTSLDDIGPVVTRRRRRGHDRHGPRRARGPEPQGATWSTWPTPPAAIPSSRWACRPGPRSACMRVARARAAADGRTYVVPDDLKALARPGAGPPPAGHAPRPSSRAPRSADVLDEILRTVAGRPPTRPPEADADPPGSARPCSPPSGCWWPGGCSARIELYVLGAVLVALVLITRGGRVADPHPHRRRPASCTRPGSTPARRAGSRCGSRTRARGRSPLLSLHDAVSGTRGAPACWSARCTPGESARAAYRLPTDRRGILTVGPARGRADRSVRPGPGRRSTASGASELTVLPARRRDRAAAARPPATTRWPAPSTPTRSGAAARTSTPCATTWWATTCAASTGRRPPATTT